MNKKYKKMLRIYRELMSLIPDKAEFIVIVKKILERIEPDSSEIRLLEKKYESLIPHYRKKVEKTSWGEKLIKNIEKNALLPVSERHGRHCSFDTWYFDYTGYYSPENAESQLNISLELYNQGWREAAILVFKASLIFEGNEEALADIIRDEIEDIETRIFYFDCLKRMDPDNPAWLIDLGYLFLEDGAPDCAEFIFEKIPDPDQKERGRWLFYLGKAYADNQEFEEAYRLYYKLKKLDFLEGERLALVIHNWKKFNRETTNEELNGEGYLDEIKMIIDLISFGPDYHGALKKLEKGNYED